jgi:hypothetical protein
MASKRTKAILTLGGVFLVGALCGALAIGAFVRGEVRSSERLRDRGGFREYFAEQLELTTAQRDSLQGELDWFYGELAGLRAAAAGDLHDLIDSLDRRLVTRLSPSQVARLRATESRLRRNLPAGRPAPLEVSDVEEPSATVKAPSSRADTTQKKPAMAAAPRSPATPAPIAGDSATVADTSVASDPAEAMTGLRDRLKQRLGLSDEQSARLREIIVATRRQIRTDVEARQGYPRLQLEVAGRHLRDMDRRIVELLDESQRAAYAPIREEMSRRIREKILKQWKKRPARRKNTGGASGDGGLR